MAFRNRLLVRESVEAKAARASAEYRLERLTESYGQLQLALEDRTGKSRPRTLGHSSVVKVCAAPPSCAGLCSSLTL